MRIEFVGLPAAGKTDACKTAHSVLLRDGVDARLDCVDEWRSRRGGILTDYFTLALRRRQGPMIWTGVSWLVQRATDQRRLDVLGALSALRACAYVATVDAHIRRLEPAPAWLHDQGTVQALWSLSMRSGVEVADVVAAYAARLSWPDLVAEVRTPLPTIMQRLQQRPSAPRSLRARNGLSEALTAGGAAIDGLRKSATARSVPWLVLPEQGDAGERVAKHVEGALS